MADETARSKQAALMERLRGLGGLAVAFSGGVDSTYLLWAAHEALGERVLAVTLRLRSMAASDASAAEAFCEERGIRHMALAVDELQIEGFASNPPDRCYLCKRELFRRAREAAQAAGIAHLSEGSNRDDEGDYRPGLRALRELGVLSPLREAGLTKAEIRALSREAGLPTWDKPSMACLASRFVYGETITAERLAMVGQAEEWLRGRGFRQCRVRMHGADLARIEVPPEEQPRLLALRLDATEALRALGFRYVAMDLLGFRTGSMNEALAKK